MTHLKVAYFARSVKDMRVQLFGVVSRKSIVGSYKKEIAGEKQAQYYYNKCLHYLLERVGHFLSVNDIPSKETSVVFEEKKHDYQRLRNYIVQNRRRPLHENARYLARIAPLSITSTKKTEETLLSLADWTAYAIYQSASETKANFMIPEQRYFREIKEKFWSDPETSKIADYSLKYIMRYEMKLQGETDHLVQKLHRKKTEAK